MNSEENDDDSALPEGWIVCASKSGRKYYFNRKTGSSLWTKPQAKDAEIKESKSQRKKRKAKEMAKAQAHKNAAVPLKKDLNRKSGGAIQNKTITPTKTRNEDIMSPPNTTKKPSLSPIQKVNKGFKTSSPLSMDAGTSSNKSFISSSPLSKAGTSETPNKNRSPKKRKFSASPNQSVSGSSSSSKNSTHFQHSKVVKRKLKKNAANERLSILRANLSAELINESKQESPNTSQEKSGNDSNINESDSLHSVPHPSQFFAANKIICSMKAQLPEKCDGNEKKKDMFADIERGINDQTTEYPYMKHPVTPPQFSEASNLLSSLKSKLSDQLVTCKNKETPTVGRLANDRLQGLRSRLSNEVMQEVNEASEPQEAMDVDVKEIQPKQNVPTPSDVKDTISKENVVLVVDTNIFIHELDLIKNVMNSHIKGYSEPPTLLVPWRVVNELDNLKDSNNGKGAVCKRARPAMDYLYKSLPESDRIKVQPLRDANSHIYPCESPDDEILNCCLQQAERGKSVYWVDFKGKLKRKCQAVNNSRTGTGGGPSTAPIISDIEKKFLSILGEDYGEGMPGILVEPNLHSQILLSNDKNLCTKALANGVPRRSLAQFTLTAPAQPRAGRRRLRRVQARIYSLLANILENEMRAKYNELWLHVVATPPPWTLADVLKCLLKHWIAVFHEVFPRIEHLFTELSHSLDAIEKNAPNITQSQLQNFKELCIEVARRCQIIPEYMELAKTTVANLQKNDDDDDDENDDDKDDVKCDESAVIEAFEGVWTVYSSYCAKLSSGLGINHSIDIEDKLPGNDPVAVLASKLDMFGSLLTGLTHDILQVLKEDQPQAKQEESISQLERSFKDSLTTVGIDATPINIHNLKLFSTKCRLMLQEAHGKFTQLLELLQTCKNNVSNH